jgi:hypothetical protein
MGPFPDYVPYFIASAKTNTNIKFVVVSDQVESDYTDANVQFLKMDLATLNEKATKATGNTIAIQNSWKINELKPLFGRIFQDLIMDYDFWGWCDLDIIWGRIRNFLTEDILDEFDIITSRKHWTTGHFTLFRNTQESHHFYEYNEGIYSLLNSSEYLAFEECCHRWDGIVRSLDSLRSAGLPISMFDIVKMLERQKGLKVLFRDLIREYPQIPVNYKYDSGKWIDLNNQQEFMYYHLLAIKKLWRFYMPTYGTIPDCYTVTERGIKGCKESGLFWNFKRTYYCYKGLRKSLKKQNNQIILKKLLKKLGLKAAH